MMQKSGQNNVNNENIGIGEGETEQGEIQQRS